MSRRSRNRNRPSSLVPRPYEPSPFNSRAAARPPEAFEILGEDEVAQFPPEDVMPRIQGVFRPTNQIDVDFENTVSTRANAVERPPGYWKLRNGKFIEIRRMDDNYLSNCIRMCERNSLARGRRPFPTSGSAYLELLEERNRRLAINNLEAFAAMQTREEILAAMAMSNRAAEQLSAAGINPTPAAQNLLNSMTGRVRMPLEDVAEVRPEHVTVVFEPAAVDEVIDEDATTWRPGLETFPVSTPIPEQAPTILPEGAPRRRIKT